MSATLAGELRRASERRGTTRRLLGVIVVALAGVAASSASAITPDAVLDQSAAEGSSCYINVQATQWPAQIVTAGLTGSLTDVVVDLFNSSGTAPVHVTVTDVVSGAPGSTVLASGSDIPVSAGGGSEIAWDVTFSSPAHVTAGTPYAVKLTTTGSGFWGWRCNSSDPYPGGNAGAFVSSGATWIALGGTDYGFETYVAPPSHAAAEVQRLGYCSVAGDAWASGAAIAPGTFLDLVAGQPDTDPHYKGATPASYVQGKGVTCDAPPAGWTMHGRAAYSGPSTDPAAPYAFYAP